MKRVYLPFSEAVHIPLCAGHPSVFLKPFQLLQNVYWDSLSLHARSIESSSLPTPRSALQPLSVLNCLGPAVCAVCITVCCSACGVYYGLYDGVYRFGAVYSCVIVQARSQPPRTLQHALCVQLGRCIQLCCHVHWCRNGTRLISLSYLALMHPASL